MDTLVYAIQAVYNWLHIQYNILGYNVSLWEIVTFGFVVGVLWFFVRQIYDVED